MEKINNSQTLRGTVAPVADALGIGGILRRAYVQANLLGERGKFLITGRPDPSTAIVLAGSGRSGTTWLQRLLCTLPSVQPIFEPLHPRFNREVRQLMGSSKPEPYFCAQYLSPDDEDPAWTMVLEKVLTGRSRNYWTDYERTSYLPSRFLVKLIRANMMLGYIHQRFQPKIIYVIRHPCAVVNSRLLVNWHADVHDVLRQKSLLDDYEFGDVTAVLQEKDEVGAHAVWWAIENHVAMNQLRILPHYLIYYEQMVLDPEHVIKSLLSWLGYGDVTNEVCSAVLQPSRMSNSRFQYISAQDRLSRWKKSFSLMDCDRVLTWARHFGLDMYDEQPLPLHLRKVY